MPERRLLVEKDDGKKFRITLPEGAKVTFGPWSPPSGEGRYVERTGAALSGTLRVYESSKSGASVLAVFSHIKTYRDEALDYEEELIREEGRAIWKSDKAGYKVKESVSRSSSFDQLTSGE